MCTRECLIVKKEKIKGLNTSILNFGSDRAWAILIKKKVFYIKKRFLDKKIRIIIYIIYKMI